MKSDKPRKVENFTADCLCESCGASLDKRKHIWVWREHTGCSKKCVEDCEAHDAREAFAINADASGWNGNKPVGTPGLFGVDE